jgi:hypothetical protein
MVLGCCVWVSQNAEWHQKLGTFGEHDELDFDHVVNSEELFYFVDGI